jgi:hypothetical protein
MEEEWVCRGYFHLYSFSEKYNTCSSPEKYGQEEMEKQ